MRSVIISDINYRELLAIDNDKFTIEKIDEHIRTIIKENEYNIENYNLLVDKNYQLEEQLRILQKENKEKDEQLEKIKSELNNISLQIIEKKNKNVERANNRLKKLSETNPEKIKEYRNNAYIKRKQINLENSLNTIS